MIVEFIISCVFGILITWAIIKEVDKYKLRRLAKKFPEGMVTQSKMVTRLDEVPVVVAPSNIDVSKVVKELKKG